MTRREYKAGRPTTLSNAITSSDMDFDIDDNTNWPTGADGYFWVTIDGGTAQEERLLCSAQSSNNVTIATGGRGKDETTASGHSKGATVWPSWSAQDADEANAHVNGSLVQHAATTSAELRSIISDETGSGALVFGTSPTISSASLGSPTITGSGTVSGTLAGSPAPGTMAHRNIIVSATEPSSGLTDGDVWIQI